MTRADPRPRVQGTYNNQWIVVDGNAFAATGRPGGAGQLSILEQMPGLVAWQDMSGKLADGGHWPSYNIPYFPEIYNRSGFPQQEAAAGDGSFSYTKCPRARLFRAHQAMVRDVPGLQWMLRYNHYKTDPLQDGSAGHAISSRFDLCTGSEFDYFGGLDTKVASVRSMAAGNMFALAQCGPTQEQPAFCWPQQGAAEAAGVPVPAHLGQPRCFQFPWVKMNSYF